MQKYPKIKERKPKFVILALFAIDLVCKYAKEQASLFSCTEFGKVRKL